MLLKFIARGTGSAAAAAAYLTRETDSAGKERAEVAVLRGDPDQVAAVADALEFEQKYTSAVIAWAPEDQPSDAQVDRVVDEFAWSAWSRGRRPCGARSRRSSRPSHNFRRRRGACGSTKRRTGRGTWCFPRGRSTRIGRGPCKGSLPFRFRASEGVV